MILTDGLESWYAQVEKEAVLILVILVDMLKGNREKISVRSYEKAEKVEPGKVKLCILEARQPTQAGVC